MGKSPKRAWLLPNITNLLLIRLKQKHYKYPLQKVINQSPESKFDISWLNIETNKRPHLKKVRLPQLHVLVHPDPLIQNPGCSAKNPLAVLMPISRSRIWTEEGEN
jgi:hypothetical protein